MPNLTANYNLKKPLGSEKMDINVLNEKMAEGQGIREILRRELGAKSVTKKVRDE